MDRIEQQNRRKRSSPTRNVLIAMLAGVALGVPAAAAAGDGRLVGVEFGRDSVLLVVDGTLQRTHTFTLEDPPRLVVDLYGVSRNDWQESREVAWGAVRRMRISQHPDRTRVAFDLERAITRHEVLDSPRGARIRILVEEDESQPERVPAALDEELVSTPTSDPRPEPALIAATQAERAPERAPPEDVLELTVGDAIRMALEHNLELEIGRTSPAGAEQDVRTALSAYEPMFTAAFTKEQNETPAASAFEQFFSGLPPTPGLLPKLTIDADIWNYDAGFAGVLPLGLRWFSTLNTRRTDSSSGSFTLRPDYRTDWVSELTLPLLRDFRVNETDILVKRSRLAEDISLDEFRADLTDEIQRVEERYWELAAEIEGLRVAEKSLETARTLLDQTQLQYDVGVVSRVAVTQAISGAAQREVALIQAQNLRQLAQDNLLNLILAPSARRYSETRVLPETPTRLDYSFDYEVDIDAAVERALGDRPELAAAQRRVEDAELRQQLADNQKLPRFDIVASHSLIGISGEAKDDPVSGSPQTFDGGEGPNNALHDIIEGEDRSWSVMAQFEFPLGNVGPRSQAAKRRIELRRSRAELRRLEQEVILETRKAARDLESALALIRAEERGRDAAAEALRAEQERLRLGNSTPFQVLQFEEDLAEAENGLIRALRAYRVSLTNLERAQGTLLASRSVRVEEELER